MKLNIFFITVCAFCISCNNTAIENKKEQVVFEDSVVIQEQKKASPQIKFLTEKILLDSLNAELYFTRAKANENLEYYKLAVDDYEKAIKINPKNTSYYLNLNQLFVNKKDVVSAIAILTKAIENVPSNEEIYLQLAKNYLYINDPQKTILTANSLLKINSTNQEAYFFKAIGFTQIGDTLKAISTYQTAIEQNPDYYEAFLNLGLLCQKQNSNLAIQYLQNAIRIKPKSKEAIYALAYQFQQLKKYKEAKEWYKKLIEVDQNFVNAFYNTGYIYFQQDSLDLAKKHFEICAKIVPNMAKAYYMRGLVAEAKGDFDNAKKDYNRTLGFDSKNKLAINGLARLKNKTE